ncbi:hypothetical protein Bca4012_062047 [Brassica carinata]|uniref:Ubiquinone biosynthesis protein n=1 Tax=Brassica carinata TaxID=52824 RepID=A0A8X7SAZ4_BRACI|nr:hypothetical protein Bca52824_031926 [Brassica carinata]
MYRTAAKRFLGVGFTTSRLLRLPKPRPNPTIITPYSHASALCTSSIGHTESPIGNQSVNPNQSDPTAASSSTAREEGPRRDESSRKKPRAEFEEEQARVLAASLRHVPRLGWTEEAMIAGSREVGVSPSIVGSFSRKEAALVEYFMDECLQLLIDRVDSGLDLQNLIPSERVSKLVRIRLEMQIPYMSKWPQALSIQAHPVNVPTSFKQRAMLVDEIWHTVGDGASDLDWYVKRTVLGGVYSTTEIYMLTDDSPEYRDTWAFLDDRVKDAFDLKKSIQEAKYFAQDIGAGVGKSFQGLMNGVMQTMSRRGGSSAF